MSASGALQGALVVSAPDDCDDAAFAALRRRALDEVYATAARGLVIDVSHVMLLDSTLFAILADTARMAGLLGARTIFAGFGPGVVSALVDLDVPYADIESALDVEDALALLRELRDADAAAPEADPQDAGPDQDRPDQNEPVRDAPVREAP